MWTLITLLSWLAVGIQAKKNSHNNYKISFQKEIFSVATKGMNLDKKSSIVISPIETAILTHHTVYNACKA